MKKTLILSSLFLSLGLASCDSTSGDLNSDDYKTVVKEFYRGVSAVQTGSDMGAKEMLLKAGALAPEESSIWVNLSIISFRQGDFVESNAFIQKALDLDPNSYVVNRVKGLLEKALGEFETAKTYLEKALLSDSEDTKSLYALYEIENESQNFSVSKGLLKRLAKLLSQNQVVAIEELKMMIREGDEEEVRGQLHVLAQMSESWPEPAKEILITLDSASMPDRERLSSGLRNVLLREASFRRDIREIQDPPELVSNLLDRFQNLPNPDAGPDSLDSGLRFEQNGIGGISNGGVQAQVIFQGNDFEARFLEYGPGASRFLDVFDQVSDPRQLEEMSQVGALASFDANHDYLLDLAAVHANYLAIYQQDSLGFFRESYRLDGKFTGVWAVDFDLEGDMDLFVEGREGSFAYRNNGDGTFSRKSFLPGSPRASSFLWFDFDNDGDPDPVLLNRSGNLECFSNERSGLYLEKPCPNDDARVITATDLNQNGRIELVFQDPSTNQIKASEWNEDSWTTRFLVSPGFPLGKIITADLDNNGGFDLILSAGPKTAVYLINHDRLFQDPLTVLDMRVDDVADLNGDGHLDLLGKNVNVWTFALGSGTKKYRWQNLSFRSANARGDQRINSLAIGGVAEIRAALTYQKAVIDKPEIHIGLGNKFGLDIARLNWPNGDVQAEFDFQPNELVVTQQRLKGSCPWLFAWDGEKMAFVTDFIWRSPLGLKINAQETAGIASTEDRVRIDGSLLKAKNGLYDLSITADLWESHFFDHIALVEIDHPDSTEVFVNESFIFPPPDSTIYQTGGLRPVLSAKDSHEKDQTVNLRERDAKYFDGVPLGPYQGIAEEHFVEFVLDDSKRNDLLLAYGWIRPTDSSINVALGQGLLSKPDGVHLDGLDEKGNWRRLKSNLGFPSGKHKTVIIELEKSWLDEIKAYRLRTNMEIYWDQLASAERFSSEGLNISWSKIEKADLIYRGFSKVSEKDRFSPELPNYQILEGSEPIWRDLEGYYTRFGDVLPLLDSVDDRYVIMNAGDEMKIQFRASSAVDEGFRRDYILVGDGWVKDGDYNTVASKTLGPLPTHSKTVYSAIQLALEDDPVFLEHKDDWLLYHTRYVSDDRFELALIRN